MLANHDLVKGKYGEELFESIYGPVYYSFDAGMCTMLLRRCPEETMLQAILPMTSVVG